VSPLPGPFGAPGRLRRRVAAALLAVAAPLAGCSHFGGYRRCDPVPEALLSRLPAWLSETGLYAEPSARVMTANVRSYRPRFELYSDGADKRRWIQLPVGARIDASDPDDWQFPEGTRFWKEFALENRAIETRLLQKVGPAPDDWVGAAYVWLPDGSDARLALEGEADAGGTPHDVPPATQCFGCHGGRASRVLGFSAIQLAAPADATSTRSQLVQLGADGSFHEPVPRVPVLPGDANTQSALGYLHANCGHCHNGSRPPRAGARCFDPERGFDLSLRVAELDAVTQTRAYASTVDGIVVPGSPEHSELYRRLEGGSFFMPRMPPLGSERVDAEALVSLRRWIAALPAR
jgi:hypothetical protein